MRSPTRSPSSTGDAPDLGGVRRARRPPRRGVRRGRARARLEDRAVPLQRQRVPRGAVRRASRCAACRSTSTTATSTRSSGTCSTTPTPKRSSSTRRSATGWRGVIDRLPKLKLLIEVDDGAAGPGASRASRLRGGDRRARSRWTRIARDGDDIYMLYTGGTTGMPKGVMYGMGGHAPLFVSLGYPLSGSRRPTDAAEIARARRQLADAGNRLISIPAAPLMHGTGMWLGAMIAHARGWLGRHADRSQPRRATRCCAATEEQRAVIDRDRRRRVREADSSGRSTRRRRARRAVRPVGAAR